jgi:hypothetical protein
MGGKKKGGNSAKPQPLGFRVYAAHEALDAIDYTGAARGCPAPPPPSPPPVRPAERLRRAAGCPGQVSSISDKEVAVKLVSGAACSAQSACRRGLRPGAQAPAREPGTDARAPPPPLAAQQPQGAGGAAVVRRRGPQARPARHHGADLGRHQGAEGRHQRVSSRSRR